MPSLQSDTAASDTDTIELSRDLQHPITTIEFQPGKYITSELEINPDSACSSLLLQLDRYEENVN